MPELIRHQISPLGVARVTLNRADRRNALTRAMIEELTSCLQKLAAHAQVRLIILTAEGSVFCAGMDLAEMQQRAADEASQVEWLQDSLVYRDLLTTLLETPQVTLAALPGPVLAGGVGLVLGCDLVVASETTFFSLPEPQRGITAAMVTPLLVYRAGVNTASQLLLSGRRMSAAEAHGQGLCQQVVAAEQLESTVDDWSRSILSGARSALAATKTQFRQTVGQALSAQLEKAAELSAAARATPEAREGLQAFLDKRKPGWQTYGEPN